MKYKNNITKILIAVLALTAAACGTREAEEEQSKSSKSPAGLPLVEDKDNNGSTAPKGVKELTADQINEIKGAFQAETATVSNPLIAGLTASTRFGVKNSIAEFKEGSYLQLEIYAKRGDAKPAFTSPMGTYTQSANGETFHRFVSTVQSDNRGGFWALDLTYNPARRDFALRILSCSKKDAKGQQTCGQQRQDIIFRQGMIRDS